MIVRAFRRGGDDRDHEAHVLGNGGVFMSSPGSLLPRGAALLDPPAAGYRRPVDPARGAPTDPTQGESTEGQCASSMPPWSRRTGPGAGHVRGRLRPPVPVLDPDRGPIGREGGPVQGHRPIFERRTEASTDLMAAPRATEFIGFYTNTSPTACSAFPDDEIDRGLRGEHPKTDGVEFLGESLRVRHRCNREHEATKTTWSWLA